jgi:uroporphyrinogen-III synthase
MTIVWTRGLADWGGDRGLLAGLPDVVHVPCVRLSAVTVPPVGKLFSVYVITSAHVLDFVSLPAGAVVHTLGVETARAAEKAGVRVEVHAGVRTAAELAPRLIAALAPGTTVAIPGPEVPAFDLAAALRTGGLTAEALACYRTEAKARKADGTEFSAAEAAAFLASGRGAVCFASPSAVAGFRAVFGGGGAWTAACIGPTTAASAQGTFHRVVTAAENSLMSLLATAKPLARTG